MSLSRMAQASPVPAQTVFGSEGARVRAPIACTGCASKIGTKVRPLSVDFQTPPDAAPAEYGLGSPGIAAIAEMRLRTAGPRKRNWRPPGGATPPPRRWAERDRQRMT